MAYINFSSIIISNFCKKNFSMLENYYYASGAIILNTSKRSLPNSNWDDLLCTLFLKRFIFLHNVIIRNNVPDLKNCLTSREINYNLRRKNNYEITRFNKSYASKGFYIWAPRFWQALPQSIKEITNPNLLKKLVES